MDADSSVGPQFGHEPGDQLGCRRVRCRDTTIRDWEPEEPDTNTLTDRGFVAQTQVGDLVVLQ